MRSVCRSSTPTASVYALHAHWHVRAFTIAADWCVAEIRMQRSALPPYGRAMVTVSELQARVESNYQRLDLPSWPDPHPDMMSPGQAEYSRLTAPGRYRIIQARAGVWAQVLVDALGVHAETFTPASVADNGPSEPFDRGVRLVPRPPGTLPLLLLDHDVPTQTGDQALPVLRIAVVRPDVVVDMQPDCGCDACDSGSRDLLEAIDATIRHVVGGPFVVLRGSKWHAVWHPEGGSAGGTRGGPDFRGVTDVCRRLAQGETVRLPSNTEALIGRSWLS
jgi:hypothetical protein